MHDHAPPNLNRTDPAARPPASPSNPSESRRAQWTEGRTPAFRPSLLLIAVSGGSEQPCADFLATPDSVGYRSRGAGADHPMGQSAMADDRSSRVQLNLDRLRA